MNQLAVILVVVCLGACYAQFQPSAEAVNNLRANCSQSAGHSLYNYTYHNLLSNNTVSFTNLKSKVILIINVATFCTFTAQYLQLNKLKNKYRTSLEIVGFPCHQFWKQEPAENAYELFNGLRYVRPGHNYIPNFPLSQKIDVNGAHHDNVYRFLKQSCPSPNTGFRALDRLSYAPFHERDIRWNFEKFLIAPKTGLPYKRYSSEVEPMDLAKDIEYLKSL